MNKMILEALERRIPQVADKEGAIIKLQDHVAKGNITEEQAQRFVDMMYPIEYKDIIDENGEVIGREQVTERVLFTMPDFAPPTENERLEAIEQALMEVILNG